MINNIKRKNIFLIGILLLVFIFLVIGVNLKQVIDDSTEKSKSFTEITTFQNHIVKNIILDLSLKFIEIEKKLDGQKVDLKNIDYFNYDKSNRDSELKLILNDLKTFSSKMLTFQEFISNPNFTAKNDVYTELNIYKREYHTLVSRLSSRLDQLITERSYKESVVINKLSNHGYSIFLFGVLIFSALAFFLSKSIGKLEYESIELEKVNHDLEKINKFKSEFLANMSHEIRTPMNGVIGMSQLLCESGLSEKQLTMAQTIQTCGDSLLIIINDILDYSKMESGKLDLEYSNFNINNFSDDLLFLFSAPASQKHIILQKKISTNTPVYLNGDVTRLRQIISNLISNAIKFTQKNGTVSLNISSIKKDDEICLIEFLVKDNGIGIKKENQEKLFDAFTQADLSTTREFGGTGLGLTISSKLAELMNAKLILESSYGEGTSIRLCIPLKIDKEKTKQDRDFVSQNNFELMYQKYHHKILLVEDNTINQKIAKMMLKKFGYDCDLASNGFEAIKAIKSHKKGHYTLVLMDMMMPEMDGITATTKIIEYFENTHINIVAMTANAFKEDKERCFKAGMVDYISKPIQLTELKKVLEKYGVKTKKAS